MTVGELKKLLENVSDHADVYFLPENNNYDHVVELRTASFVKDETDRDSADVYNDDLWVGDVMLHPYD